MNPSPKFLPDLGKYILTTSGKKEFRIAGDFSLSAISWHGDEFRSITGLCHVDGLDYVASLDFSMKPWNKFAQLLRAAFYLDCDHVDSTGKVVTMPLEHGLPVWIDLLVVPQATTESTKTGEKFVPIGVQKVFGVRLVPNLDILRKRHDWYVKFSGELLDAFGEDATILRQCISHRFHRIGPFEIEDFHRNLVACFLIRQAIADEPIEQVLEFLTNEWKIKFSKIPKLVQSIAAIGRNVGDKKDMLISGCMSLLIWHLAMKIYAGATSPSIERDLVSQWGSSYEGAIDLVGTARYCLARREQWSQRTDQLEKDILQVEAEDPQVSALIKTRVSECPAAVWQHPELSPAVKAYVRYSVLIELSKKGKRNLVTNEMLVRCCQNVLTVADWWYMFTPSEEHLFPL